MPADFFTVHDRTTYIGTCACGRTIGHLFGFDTRHELEAAHKAHVKDMRALRRRRSAPDVPACDLTVIHLDRAVRRMRYVDDCRATLDFATRELAAARAMLVDRVDLIVARLRDAANDIDRRLTEYRATALDAAHEPDAGLVENVVHEVNWMVPNLNLDHLVARVTRIHRAEADVAAAKAALAAARATAD